MRVDLADIVNWVDIRGTVVFGMLAGVGLSHGALAAIAAAATVAEIVFGLSVIADR